MTTATKAARPRTTHAQHNGAQHNGAQHNGAAAIDAELARITQIAAAGVSQTSNVADDIVTSLSLTWMGRELTMIVRSVVRLAQGLSGRVAGEFGKVVGLSVDVDQQADICFGDPTAWV